MFRRRRDAFGDVGAATRLAVERAMPGLTLPEARVLLRLVHVLTSWSRMEDALAVRQLAEATGMDERAVRRALAGLIGREAIVRTQSPGRHASTYRLPSPNGTNQGSSDQGSPTPNQGSGDQGSSDHGLSQPWSTNAPNPGSGDPPNPGSLDHLPEKCSRAVLPEKDVTPLPPAEQGDSETHHGQHPNCRACGTSRRARAVVDEIAARRDASGEAEARTRSAGERGSFDAPPPEVLDAHRHLPRRREIGP